MPRLASAGVESQTQISKSPERSSLFMDNCFSMRRPLTGGRKSSKVSIHVGALQNKNKCSKGAYARSGTGRVGGLPGAIDLFYCVLLKGHLNWECCL